MSFFIDAGPYVLAAITLTLFIVVMCALKAASDADDRLEASPTRVPLAGSGSSGSPLGSLPVRADEMGVSFVGAEFDQEWSQAEWAWPR